MNPPNPLLIQPIRSLFFKYYFPILTSMLSVTAHQVVNGLILSRQVGKVGVAAIGLYGPVSIVLVSVTLPLVIGGGILISRSLGENNPGRVQDIFNFSTSLALVMGCFIAALSPFLADHITSFVAGDQDVTVAENTSSYILWQFVGLPFFFLRMIWGTALSNDAMPKISRNANILAVVINIVLDVFLIVIFPFGVTGASIATSLAIFLSTVFLFWHIRKETGHFGFRRFQFTLRLTEWKTLVSLGSPSFVSEVSFALGLLIINRSVLAYGPMAVSAFGIVNYVSFIFLRFFTSAMAASLPIMSFNFGAGQPQRVTETVRFAIGFTLSLGVLVVAAGWLFPQPVIHIFAGENSSGFDQLASRSLQLYFLLFLAAGPNFVAAAYFQATGKAAFATVINLLKGIALLTVFTAILPKWLGLEGIWLARGSSECVAMLVAAVLWFVVKKH